MSTRLSSLTYRLSPSGIAVTPPPDAPALLQSLFTELQTSPFLDPRYIVLTKPVDRPLAAPAPFSAPKGRRRRGGSDHGPGVGAEPIGQIWSWLLLLQLKDGIKSGSSVEHVAKAVRKLVRGLLHLTFGSRGSDDPFIWNARLTDRKDRPGCETSAESKNRHTRFSRRLGDVGPWRQSHTRLVEISSGEMVQ